MNDEDSANQRSGNQASAMNEKKVIHRLGEVF